MRRRPVFPFKGRRRVLKREFVERKQCGEEFTERQLMDLHAYLPPDSHRIFL